MSGTLKTWQPGLETRQERCGNIAKGQPCFCREGQTIRRKRPVGYHHFTVSQTCALWP
jgi:hypothetical protein